MQKQNILLLSAYCLAQGLHALKLDADGALLVMDDEIVDVFDLPQMMEDFSDSYDYQDFLELRKAQGLIEQTSGSHLEQSSPHWMTLQNDMDEEYEEDDAVEADDEEEDEISMDQTSNSHLEQSSPHWLTLQNDMDEKYDDIPFDDDDYEGAEEEEEDDAEKDEEEGDDESIMHRPNSMAQLSDGDDDDESEAYVVENDYEKIQYPPDEDDDEQAMQADDDDAEKVDEFDIATKFAQMLAAVRNFDQLTAGIEL